MGDGYSLECLEYRIHNKNMEMSEAEVNSYEGEQREYAMCLREIVTKPMKIVFDDCSIESDSNGKPLAILAQKANGFDMIRSIWEDPDNEYFHPSVYKIVRDEEKHDYYISERYDDRDEEKDVYYEKNGNVPTFDRIEDAVRYVQNNNISVINTAGKKI